MKEIFEQFKNDADGKDYWEQTPGEVPVRTFLYSKTKELPDPEPIKLTLTEAIQKRRSFKGGTTFDTNTQLALTDISTILGTAHSFKNQRPAPSGGGLHPIEVYLISRNIEGIESGMYYYNKLEHQLIPVRKVNNWTPVQDLVPVPYFNDAPAVIIYSYKQGGSLKKYGAFSVKLGILEAGHFCQNAQLVSTGLGIGSRPLGSAKFPRLSKMLRMGPNEVPFYGIAFGN